MIVVTAPDVRQHDPPHEIDLGRVVSPVWERAARYDVLAAAVADAGLPTVAPRAHGPAAWTAVHDPELVAWLRTAHARWVAAGGPEVLIPDTFAHRAWAVRRPVSPIGEAGWWMMDTATPIVAGSFAAAAAAVDAALTAVSLVLDDGARSAHALTRPPGHHAGRAYIGGFCLVNHAAIAARALRDRVGRVAVIDVDHHHGNGTQEIFLDDPQVLYTSLHADPAAAYPWYAGFADETGVGPGTGATHNVPLPRGIDDDTYLQALDGVCEVVAAHDPAVVVLSLGTDTADVDPVGGLGLSPAAYPRIGAAVAALGVPVVGVQEGGYALDRLGGDTVAVLRALG